MNSQLDLNLLTVFLSVYRFNSYTLAAQSLDMTQPGVSGSLKRLKDQLGCELFIREGRGIAPTAAAIKLANELEPGLNLVNNALNNMKAFDPEQEYTFRVLANESAIHLLQPLVVQDDSMGRCRIHFMISPSTDTELQHLLNFQKADLAIDITASSNPAYVYQPLFTESLSLICRQDNPEFQGSCSKQAFFNAEHVILKSKRSEHYIADLHTDESLIPRQVSCEVDSLFSMMALVANSQSVGIVTDTIAKRYHQQFAVNYFTLPFKLSEIQHKMIWHKREQQSQAHQWLRNKFCSLIETSEN